MKSGIIVVHKPEGISSARVVARVKKTLGVKKVGHTGTLDPFATGVLLCAVNKGTKISRFFLHGNKQYLARVMLGVETDTYDVTGKTVSKAEPGAMNALDAETVKAIVMSFVGKQDQVPPVFSALKHDGQPLYKLARQGKSIQKPPRQIEIFDLAITRMALPEIDINVSCSSGTYIRSLAFDIGRKLGCGAHLSKLCRTQSGPFDLNAAIDLDALERLDIKAAEERIIPLAQCLDFMPKILADRPLSQKIGFGQPLLATEVKNPCVVPLEDQDTFFKVVDDDNTLLAIVQLNENQQEYNYCCVFAG